MRRARHSSRYAELVCERDAQSGEAFAGRLRIVHQLRREEQRPVGPVPHGLDNVASFQEEQRAIPRAFSHWIGVIEESDVSIVLVRVPALMRGLPIGVHSLNAIKGPAEALTDE